MVEKRLRNCSPHTLRLVDRDVIFARVLGEYKRTLKQFVFSNHTSCRYCGCFFGFLYNNQKNFTSEVEARLCSSLGGFPEGIVEHHLTSTSTAGQKNARRGFLFAGDGVALFANPSRHPQRSENLTNSIRESVNFRSKL